MQNSGMNLCEKYSSNLLDKDILLKNTLYHLEVF